MSNPDEDLDDGVDVSAHLLDEAHFSQSTLEQLDTDGDEGGRPQLSHTSICKLLYTSHFLSTWNSRAFEFGAFLFLATIYPQTLLPASIYALTRSGAAAILSPWLGGYIDHADRLSVVRRSIIGQRISVAISCIILFCLCQFNSARGHTLWSYSALAILSILASIEKLAAILNTISVERDWVVTIANDDESFLRTMNSQMRRIDLFCKLIAPLSISLMDSHSSKIAIVTTALMTAISVLIEYFAIARVHAAVPSLRAPKARRNTSRTPHEGRTEYLMSKAKTSLVNTSTYVSHRAFLPSFSLALLYLTVLSFNGQMVTYLLAMGFNSAIVGVLRGVSALFELSATWFAPRIMERIGPVRSGIWFINWEILCVGIACILLWLTEDSNRLAGVVGTVAAIVASRIGLWGFDLSTQIIVQEEVELELRGTFSSQEFASQNIFEMLSFASTISFSRPAQFKIPATISAGAVGMAGILYAAFVRSRRGHLVHLPRCMERAGKSHGSHYVSSWQRLPQEEDNGLDSREVDTRAG